MKYLILAILLSIGTTAATAADFAAPPPEPVALPPMQPDPLINELRVGGFVHDPWSPESGGVDLNLEVLFKKPWGTDADWWWPRPHVGATINFEGKTSVVYGGVSWQYQVTNWMFLEATFGGGANNGETDNRDPDMNALGCNVLFRESASIGFDITESWRIMGTVEHSSNAGLCDYNRGLTNAGVRVGYKF